MCLYKNNSYISQYYTKTCQYLSLSNSIIDKKTHIIPTTLMQHILNLKMIMQTTRQYQ